MISKDTPLKDVLALAPACSCAACSHGCSVGSGFLVESDVKPLAQFLNISEEELKEKYLEEVELFNKKMLRPKILRGNKPYGPCTFFKEGKCSVHAAKPLQCKLSMGCKDYGEELMLWFQLNSVLDVDDPEALRQYAQYLKAGGKTIPGGKLEELVPDKEILKKILNYDVLR